MSEIVGIPTEFLDSVWPYCAPALLPSIRKAATHDPEHVLETIRKGLAHLYVTGFNPSGAPHQIKSCIVVELLHYPKVKICRVWLAGSYGRTDWRAYVRFLEQHCRENGYGMLEAIGRVGWIRIAGGGKILGPVCRKVIN